MNEETYNRLVKVYSDLKDCIYKEANPGGFIRPINEFHDILKELNEEKNYG